MDDPFEDQQTRILNWYNLYFSFQYLDMVFIKFLIFWPTICVKSKVRREYEACALEITGTRLYCIFVLLKKLTEYSLPYTSAFQAEWTTVA